MQINNPLTLEQLGGVPVTREIIAGTNMTGGGALDSDVTLNSSGGGGGGGGGISPLIAYGIFDGDAGTVLVAKGCSINLSGPGTTHAVITFDETLADTNFCVVFGGIDQGSRYGDSGYIVNGTVTTDGFEIVTHANEVQERPCVRLSFAVFHGDISGGGSVAMDSDTILTAENVDSTVYADLATVGPEITINTGTDVIVQVDARVIPSVNCNIFMAVEVSGATTIAADDDNAFETTAFAGAYVYPSRQFKISGLTPGMNTFTAKYRSNVSANVEWAKRDISVTAI